MIFLAYIDRTVVISEVKYVKNIAFKFHSKVILPDGFPSFKEITYSV